MGKEKDFVERLRKELRRRKKLRLTTSWGEKIVVANRGFSNLPGVYGIEEIKMLRKVPKKEALRLIARLKTLGGTVLEVRLRP